MRIWEGLRARIIENEPLKKHTSFRIGGPARFFIEPRDVQDLKLLLKKARHCKIKCFLIGAGSNILAPDRGIKGAVISLSSPFFRNIKVNGNRIEAGAGAPLSKVVSAACSHSLCGAEFLTGIPGTVGGAVMMNAGEGKNGSWISDLLESVTIMDKLGRVRKFGSGRIRFGYRSSSLGGKIVLSAVLRLKKGSRKAISGLIREKAMRRRLTQEIKFPNAGSIFRNPAHDSAGRLIESSGLKGRRSGGACVSVKHANFIVNMSNASAADVLRLMELARREVKHRFNIDLQPEIKIWQG